MYNSFEKKQRYADWKFVYTVGLPFGLSPGSATSPFKASNPTSDIQIYSLEKDDKEKPASISGGDVFSGMNFGGLPREKGGQ